MRVAAILLRDKGRVLKKSELAPAVVGDLKIFDWPPQGSNARFRRRAELLGHVYGSVRPTLLMPLHDVQVLKVNETGLYLQGTEIDSCDGGRLVFEHIQVWLCQPTNADISREGPAMWFGRTTNGTAAKKD